MCLVSHRGQSRRADEATGFSVQLFIKATSEVGLARPAGAAGASLYTYIGETPPTDLSGWNAFGNVTRRHMRVDFPNWLPPGARVWAVANWYSPRGEAGPFSNIVGTNIPGGTVTFTGGLKAA